MTDGPVKIFIVAGENSGDQLGAALMRALNKKLSGKLRFSGVGGPLMQAEKLDMIFPSSDISLMGPTAILLNFPILLRRLKQTVAAILADPPAMVVVIDSPEFTQRVAKRVRAKNLSIPILKYVAPQVWAWRPHRARKMKSYIDEILALLPFEPEAYHRLDGPRTTYVGHPLMEREDLFEPGFDDHAAKKDGAPILALLPGSRSTEVDRLLPVFGETAARLHETHQLRAFIPVVPHLRERVLHAVRGWTVQPVLIEGTEAKWALFRRAHVALAASGTVTLELALAKVPMVVAYKVEGWMEPVLRRLISIHSIVLPNLILGKNVVPEFYQKDVQADILVPAIEALLGDTPARQSQLNAFENLERTMKLPSGQSPADAAAERVIANLPAYLREATGT